MDSGGKPSGRDEARAERCGWLTEGFDPADLKDAEARYYELSA
jgi:hypothetical protein